MLVRAVKRAPAARSAREDSEVPDASPKCSPLSVWAVKAKDPKGENETIAGRERAAQKEGGRKQGKNTQRS